MPVVQWDHPVVILAIVLFTATYAKYVLKWSTSDFLKWTAKELRELLSATYSPLSINGAALIIGSVILIAALFAPKFDKLLQLGIDAPASSSSLVYGAISALSIWLFTLLCLNIVRR